MRKPVHSSRLFLCTINSDGKAVFLLNTFPFEPPTVFPRQSSIACWAYMLRLRRSWASRWLICVRSNAMPSQPAVRVNGPRRSLCSLALSSIGRLFGRPLLSCVGSRPSFFITTISGGNKQTFFLLKQAAKKPVISVFVKEEKQETTKRFHEAAANCITQLAAKTVSASRRQNLLRIKRGCCLKNNLRVVAHPFQR